MQQRLAFRVTCQSCVLDKVRAVPALWQVQEVFLVLRAGHVAMYHVLLAQPGLHAGCCVLGQALACQLDS